MATQKQIDSNRQNGLLSDGTGNPLVSRFNPSKHNLAGAIVLRPDENEKEYNNLILASIEFYKPRTLLMQHDAVLRAQMMWQERRGPEALSMAEFGNLTRDEAIAEMGRVMRYTNGLGRQIDRLHRRMMEAQKFRPVSENEAPFDMTPYLNMKFPIVRLDRMDRVKYHYLEEGHPLSRVQRRHQQQIQSLRESYRENAEQKRQAQAEILQAYLLSQESDAPENTPCIMEERSACGEVQANIPLSRREELEDGDRSAALPPRTAQETFNAFLETFAHALQGNPPEEPESVRPTDPLAGQDSLPGPEGNDNDESFDFPDDISLAMPAKKGKKTTKAQKKTKRKQRKKLKRKHRHR